MIPPNVDKSRLICNLGENAAFIISWLWRKLMDKVKFFLYSSPELVAYALYGRAFSCSKCERECDGNLPSALINVYII